MNECKRNRHLVLSFDDGPGKLLTPLLLEILEKNNVKATFFLLGSKIEKNELIIKKMNSLGHEIGCHGYAHLNALKNNPFVAIRDISMGVSELSKINVKCRLFRPPYGKINIFTMAYILCENLKFCWWSHDSGDTHAQLSCPRSFAKKVISEGGGVVLMHDHDRSEKRMEFVIQATKHIIEEAIKHNIKIKTFGEIIEKKF